MRIARPLLTIVLSAATGVLPAQERVPPPLIDEVVNAMCRKQVVLLGEAPTHGEALTFETKARIVDRLTAACGFTAVLFEAPVYDFVGLARAVGTRTATPALLDNAIGRFWQTRELGPWRRALFDAANGREVVVGGLDDQISITSYYARETLPQLIAAGSAGSAGLECRETVSRHVGWTYDIKNPFDDSEKHRLQQCAQNAADAAAADQSVDPADRVMLNSFARYVTRQRQGAATGRDDSMYQNLTWYLEHLPANSRVVVWTATVHAARQRGPLSEVPMGARLAERFGDRVGAVGFTAAAGDSSTAGRPVRPIPDAPAGSLEATTTANSSWALLDAARLRALGSVPSRLLGKFTSETWSNYFDVVVVIRTEVAPTFDPWK